MIGQLIEYIKEQGYGENIDSSKEFVTVYHGTSKGACTLINKKGRIKNYPFFSGDLDTATRFGYAAITRGKPTVMAMKVSLDSLGVTGGYLSANTESLYRGEDGIWRSDAQS